MSESSPNFDCAVCGLTNKEFKYYGIGECNHPICAICAIKLAKFSKDGENDYDYSKCVICKQYITKIVISSIIKPFDLFNESDLTLLEKYGLLFDGVETYKFYQNAVKISCQKCICNFDSIDDLFDHVEVHKMRYCKLCGQFNKCLPSEFLLMTDNDFHHHNIKEHPKCKFCNKRYYDDAQLMKHAKERHFLCDICHRRQGFVAYDTQNELLKHFLNDHHVCEICRSAGNINVFDSEYNLKTHKVLEHDNKGLISEGLVNVNYGDTGNRYGSRRRARDNDDAIFDEVPATTNQPLPEMGCESEFPRLNANVSPQNRQLGAKSVTNDENDSRGAFLKKNGQQEECKKPQVTKSKETVATHIPYSMKQSMGKINDSDFPSLSSDIQVPRPSGLESKNVKSTQVNTEPLAQKKKINMESDFPALSSRVTKSTAVTPTWKPSDKPAQATNHTTAKSVPVAKPVKMPREPSPVEVDMELEREMGYKPKIQIMKRDEFEQSSIKNTGARHCPVPQEADFPVLGNSKGTSNSVTTSTMSGAWGQYNVTSQKPKDKATKWSGQDHFKPDNPLDFPELPFKQKPIENLPSKKNKQAKKNGNFANAVTAPVPTGKAMKPIVTTPKKCEPIQKEVEPEVYVPRQTSSSTRGQEYIPCVVPTNENVIFVDTKQFTDLKNPKLNDTADEGRLSSNNYENNFPAPAMTTNNHFNVLCEHNEGFESEKKSAVKVEVKKVPKLNSNADFPSLGGRKVTVESAPVKPKKEERKIHKEEYCAPVMSLADVALSVTMKNYTPYSDADERNQVLFEAVNACLDNDSNLSHQFLALSGAYRNRKVTVQSYLESVNTIFANQLDIIAVLLPQMLVLLPDISLQKSLFNHMPKQWTAQLKECLKCGQIINKVDTEDHNKVAH